MCTVTQRPFLCVITLTRTERSSRLMLALCLTAARTPALLLQFLSMALPIRKGHTSATTQRWMGMQSEQIIRHVERCVASELFKHASRTSHKWTKSPRQLANPLLRFVSSMRWSQETRSSPVKSWKALHRCRAASLRPMPFQCQNPWATRSMNYRCQVEAVLPHHVQTLFAELAGAFL